MSKIFSPHYISTEVDGSAPEFLLKPRSFTANIGEKAIFSCRIQGDPEPEVAWLFKLVFSIVKHCLFDFFNS